MLSRVQHKNLVKVVFDFKALIILYYCTKKKKYCIIVCQQLTKNIVEPCVYSILVLARSL